MHEPVTIEAVRNQTTRQNLKDPAKNAELVEVSEDAVVFFAPPGFCQQGHRLEISFSIRDSARGESYPFPAEFEVVSLEGDPNEFKMVRATLVHQNQPEWRKLVRAIGSLQEKTAELFSRLKK